MTSQILYHFPKEFLWGTATSAHQTEGNNLNDWSVWEPGKTIDGSVSSIACGSYHYFKKDISLAKKLNNNAYRFSIEWSRIEPKQGQFNTKALRHYQAVINECLKQKIKPVVTLHHFTHPLWFSTIGGWENQAAPHIFNNYVIYLAQNITGVEIWCTINEPMIYAWNAYGRGHWPPQKRNLNAWQKVVNNLIQAHSLAYQSLHLANKKCLVGIANNSQYFEPVNDYWFNKKINKIAKYIINDYFFQKISGYQDYLGINYYFYKLIGLGRRSLDNLPHSDLGWPINPYGLYDVLMSAKKYNLPIYILENGIADAKDQYRTDFIREHLKMVHRAIQNGCDIKGYFYWSLLDNFEWDKGFTPRFGLYTVDYPSLKRQPRPSSKVYANICKNNGL